MSTGTSHPACRRMPCQKWMDYFKIKRKKDREMQMTKTIVWKNLTPEQRDKTIAENVIGAKILTECKGELGEQAISPDGWYCLTCGHMGAWGDDSTHEQIPPHYSTSIGGAWRIVDFFRGTYDVDVASALFQYDVAILDRRMHGKQYVATANT